MRIVLMCLAVAAWSAPAQAQFQVGGEPAVGEKYFIEGSAVLWNADPAMVISSESLGIPGDDVDLVADLGIAKKQIRELKLVLRPGRKHKFRFNYLPLKYEAAAAVPREFTFNGLRYRVGIPVNTTADLTTYRVGYEYDFIYRERGYLGVLLDVKYTDVNVTLDSPLGSAFTEQVAPIPTLGLVGRGYVTKNVSITGEVTYFKIPENLSDSFGGKYLDYDFYSTFNFTHNVGAQVGFRSVEVEYFRDLDAGNLKFTGWYFGGVLRY